MNEGYKVPIWFYNPSLSHTSIVYDDFSQWLDRDSAKIIHSDPKQRAEKYDNHDYEFLLGLSNADDILQENIMINV